MIKYTMRNLILVIITIISANGQENFNGSFITKYEYGKMLYFNPRGISCTKCHADDAKGKTISTFKHIWHKKEYMCTIKTKDITGTSYTDFVQKLDPNIKKKKKKFKKGDICGKLIYKNSMPTYFLTKDELSSIHFYLKNKVKYE